MQFIYTKILYICTGDIRDIMTNVYMAALHSRIDHMGPPPSTMGGNPFGGPCCPSFCGISTPRIGMALAGSFYNAPMMGFGGFGYSSSMPSLFAIAAATAMTSSVLASKSNVGTFGSLTMPQFATPTFQFQPINYTMPTYSLIILYHQNISSISLVIHQQIHSKHLENQIIIQVLLQKLKLDC